MEYTMKNIDEKFWHRVKIMAAVRGKTIKNIILALLKREIEAFEEDQDRTR